MADDEIPVDPAAVRTYLVESGLWQPVAEDARRSIFEHVSGDRVFLPAEVDVDYRVLLAELARSIARAETRDVAEVWSSLIWQRFDRLHVRRLTVESSVTFATGLEMHEALHDLIVAAARASVEPRAQYRGQRPNTVDEYLDRVRLIPSRSGSFLLRALLPVEPPTASAQLELTGVAVASPVMRRSSQMLLSAARAAVDTATSISTGVQQLDTWESAVQSGVSANLCDALARLTGYGLEAETVELSIDWVWSGLAESEGPVTVPGGLAPALTLGGIFLRGQPDQQDIRVTGTIIKLHRENQLGAGEVTVKGVVEGLDDSGRTRNVRIPLDEATYHEAVVAHDQGRTVTTRLTATPAPSGLVVSHVHSWRVVED